MPLQKIKRQNNFDNSKNVKELFRSKFFAWVYKTLIWLQSVSVFDDKILDCSRFSKGVKATLLKFDHVLVTRGRSGLIIIMKSVRGAYLRYLANAVDRSIKGVPITSDGYPKFLEPLMEFSKVTYNFLKNEATEFGCPKTAKFVQQIILTLLTSTRCLKANCDPDTSTITTHGIKPIVVDEKILRSFWRSLRVRPFNKVPKSLAWTRFHPTQKAGPNGQAIATCIDDLKALNEYPSLLKAIGTVGGRKLSEKLQILNDGLEAGAISGSLPIDKKLKIRKIVSFPDKEGKQRVVALFDYFSQTALRPLHSWLFKQLKKIPQDCTFNQGSFMDKLLNAEVFYCIDLRAFTDRFPMWFNCELLKSILPAEYVSSWEEIMVGYPFSFQRNKKAELWLSYNCGNPMGAYSSWNSTSLAHHFVVFLACSNLKISWQSLPYCLLGDDLVIGQTAVAEEYIKIISSLGVEIAYEKSYTSSHFIEFAKRWVLYGTEVSPFPLSALKESSKRYYSLVNTFLNGEGKGWNFISSIPRIVQTYYRQVKYFRAKRCSELHDKSVISESMIKFIGGDITASMCLTTIARNNGDLSPEHYISERSAKAFLSNIAAELFSDSHPFIKARKLEGSKDPPRPLGSIRDELYRYFNYLDSEYNFIFPRSNEDLLLNWNDRMFKRDLGHLLKDSHPICCITAYYEEVFKKIEDEAYSIDTVGNGDWPYVLRSFIYPSSDEIFTIRSAALLPVASSVVGKEILYRFQILSQYQMWPEMLATIENPYADTRPESPVIDPISF